jgi:hypothetical protein
MNVNEICAALLKESKENQAADAFFHVCAMRKRDRTTLTIKSITQRMKKEGFKFEVVQYEKILKLLAVLELGTLQVNKKGVPLALINIKAPLQSIGMAATGQPKKLEAFLPTKKSSLVATAEMVKTSAATKALWGSGATARGPHGYPVSITVVVNGKPVNFRVPKELTKDDIADLVVRFRSEGFDKEN